MPLTELKRSPRGTRTNRGAVAYQLFKGAMGARLDRRPLLSEKKKTANTFGRDNWVWSSQGVINMHLPEHWGYIEFAESPEKGGALDAYNRCSNIEQITVCVIQKNSLWSFEILEG